jgi:Pentapeptide repeats (8 copies)
MEVLIAYVRQHAPWRPEETQQVEEDAATEKKSEEDSSGESEPSEVHPAPAPDIQAIMTVIRRRTRSYRQGEPEPLDLTETNLSGADFSGAHLWLANLSGADLTKEQLQLAESLEGATMPDGQNYEDWLKDKEGRKEDTENE